MKGDRENRRTYSSISHLAFCVLQKSSNKISTLHIAQSQTFGSSEVLTDRQSIVVLCVTPSYTANDFCQAFFSKIRQPWESAKIFSSPEKKDKVCAAVCGVTHSRSDALAIPRKCTGCDGTQQKTR